MVHVIRPQSCRGCAHGHQDGRTRYCRAHPPSVQAIIVQTPAGPQMAGTVANFPAVQEDWWCGEWRPRVGAEN